MQKEINILIELMKSKKSNQEKVDIYNNLMNKLRDAMPFSDPVLFPNLIKSYLVEANDYNPNNVAPPEMKLLKLSIQQDGITQPVVTYRKDNSLDLLDKYKYEIVDGFHRNKIIKEDKEINEKINNYIPVVMIDKKINDRKASTIRHNRARGKHGVRSMSELVSDLIASGWDMDKIGIELGMDEDEVLRLYQMDGLASLYKDKEYSKAWE